MTEHRPIMPRGSEYQEGRCPEGPGLSQVEPADAVSPLRASIPSARDGNDIWGNLPVGPRVLRLAIKELDDTEGLCLYEIENEIGYLESVDIILHQVKLMQWRPISTAPTNGTHILGARVGSSPARVWFEDGRWWMHGCGPNSQNAADLTGSHAPTDWMPLPLPPAPCDGCGEAGETEGLDADDALNARLKAAGMYTIPEMMGVTPLSRWMVQAGMTDLDFFQAWLDRRLREFLRMKAQYELGDKDKRDELYEWVLAHSAALSEVRDNFLAARAAMPAPCDEPPKGEDGLPAEGRSPAGAVPEGQAPASTPSPQETARDTD